MSDEDLQEFAADFREGMLEGGPSAWMCRAVCLPLSSLLQMRGVETALTEGIILSDEEAELYHTWLTLPDGKILDPTADQFNDWISGLKMPPVYLGPKPEIYLNT